jgi:flagella basal body P-ring formation protein FlgA
MMLLAAIALTGCLAVNASSDHITAGDLAAAIPGLAAPSSEEVVALAPAPGVPRIFHVPELRRLALRLHWEVEPPGDICFERPVSPPDPAKFLEAMRKSLPEAAITIVDYGRQALPEGDIEFPVSGLRTSPSGAFWSGYIQFAGTHRFTLWARVKALVTVSRVIADVDLRPGEAIAAAQVHVETREEFPATAPFPKACEEVAGKWPRAAIRAGVAIAAAMIENPKEVVRGDTVTVDVRDGAAHLELEARAEASGAAGETIPILNPVSHKIFLARVEGKGRVSVSVAVIGPGISKGNQ